MQINLNDPIYDAQKALDVIERLECFRRFRGCNGAREEVLATIVQCIKLAEPDGWKELAPAWLSLPPQIYHVDDEGTPKEMD